MLQTNYAESGGFIYSSPNLHNPDCQFHFVPALVINHGRTLGLMQSGFTLHICHLRPRSRGYLSLNSKNPFAPPKIVMNYLKDKQDLEELTKGV